jgi:hypothetical protein
VPPVPPEAVIVALPQKVPPPLPVTGPGAAFTVTIVVETHPCAVVYAMVEVPLARPVNKPPALIVPTDVLLLLQVPPVTVLDNDRLLPVQTPPPPEIAAFSFTVTIAVAWHPEGTV